MTRDGWAKRPLGDFCTQISERAGKRDLPVLSISKDLGIVLQSEKFKKRIASVDISNYKCIRRGQFAYDPMLLWAGNIGRQLRVDTGVVSPAYTVFDAANIDPAFLERVFKDPRLLSIYRNVSRGTNVRRQKVLFSDFASILLLVPPLPEQRKIAAILSAVEEVIETTKSLIESLQTLRKAMMQALLTRGLPGRHTRFKRTDIGEIPEEWTVAGLPSVVDYQNGKAFPSQDYASSGVLLVRPGNLHADGFVRWDDRHTTYLPTTYWDSLPGFRVEPGELLMNLTAQSLEDGFLGRVCEVPDGPGCLLNQRIARITPKGVDRRFVYWALSGPHFRAHADLVPQGTKVKHLYNRDLDGAMLPLPSRHEQERIAAALDAVQRRAIEEQLVLDRHRLLKAALTTILLSGELRVTPDEGAA